MKKTMINSNYCKYCKKEFKSRMSLWMHYTKSKFHRKESCYYHQKPNIRKIADSDKYFKIDDFLPNK